MLITVTTIRVREKVIFRPVVSSRSWISLPVSSIFSSFFTISIGATSSFIIRVCVHVTFTNGFSIWTSLIVIVLIPIISSGIILFSISTFYRVVSSWVVWVLMRCLSPTSIVTLSVIDRSSIIGVSSSLSIAQSFSIWVSLCASLIIPIVSHILPIISNFCSRPIISGVIERIVKTRVSVGILISKSIGSWLIFSGLGRSFTISFGNSWSTIVLSFFMRRVIRNVLLLTILIFIRRPSISGGISTVLIVSLRTRSFGSLRWSQWSSWSTFTRRWSLS